MFDLENVKKKKALASHKDGAPSGHFNSGKDSRVKSNELNLLVWGLFAWCTCSCGRLLIDSRDVHCYLFIKRSQSLVRPQNSFFHHGDKSAFHMSSYCSPTSSTESTDFKTFHIFQIQIVVTQSILIERAKEVQCL